MSSVIQVILRQSDVATTQSYYIKMIPKDAQPAMAQFAKAAQNSELDHQRTTENSPTKPN